MLCQCPKLTQLQSRFVASFLTLVLVGIVYWTLANPYLAEAAELAYDGNGEARHGADHNWHRKRIEEPDVFEGERDTRETQTKDIQGNDSGNRAEIRPNQVTVWRYSNSLRTSDPTQRQNLLPNKITVSESSDGRQEDLKKRDGIGSRQGQIPVYISINTCTQPRWTMADTQWAGPPQLTLYVSTDPANTSPGPNATLGQEVIPLIEGFTNSYYVPTEDLYMAVSAPDLAPGFQGQWNYEIAVSLTDFFHSAAGPDQQILFLVDTDSESALLVTNDLAEAGPDSDLGKQWMALKPPYVLFGADADSKQTLGVSYSYCGWSNVKQFGAAVNETAANMSTVETRMITRGPGGKPKEQFHVSGLNRSTGYQGVLAMTGNSVNSGQGVVGGGGKVWPIVKWQTKSDGNCQLLFDMEFCHDVAYAVPSNPSTLNNTQLRSMFDNYTSTYYQQFNYSLQLIPCETTSEARYSLAKDCTDCATAYKQWLCAVSIPRCEDFSNPAQWLQPRNVGARFLNGTGLPDTYLNQQYMPMSGAPTLPGSPRDTQTYGLARAANYSRDPGRLIDTQIMPGPYKEVLPCEDLCWGLVQSCPAALQFACPLPGRGLEVGYGKRSKNGTLTCSFAGAVYETNSAPDVGAPVSRAVILSLLAGFILVVA